MLKKLFYLLLVGLFVSTISQSPVHGHSREFSSADEAKTKVAKLGTGPKAVVRVTLQDNKKVQGWLSFKGEDHFTVTDGKSGALTDITYSEVRQIKSLKPSKGALIVSIVGGLALSVAIFLFV